MYIKSPFNWTGNKYKYIDKINKQIINKKYDKIIDVFMGSGNILFNINATANQYIGNDIIKLIPNIYNKLIKNKYEYTINDFNKICNNYTNFSNNEDYYNFRKYWNLKYKNDQYDFDFILETILLFKMCSNSMIRFNKKQEFNQGYRGCKTSFFKNDTKNNIIKSLNDFICYIYNNNYFFTNNDCLEILNNINNDNNLLILDPPYVLSTNGIYNNKTYNKEKDLKILNYLLNTNNDFIYFNYLTSNDIIYKELEMFSKKYQYIIINDKNVSGQNRKNKIDVKEIMIYNFN